MSITLRAKSPADLLAAIPVTLGFEPQDSVVMLTLGGETPLHARIDLPPRGDPEALTAVVESLLAPCRRHRASRVVFVLYGSDAAHCRLVARSLRRDFEGRGIEVVDCLRADAGRWFVAEGRRAGIPVHGVPYDSAGHPFRAQAVMEGHVTLGSREELAASIGPDEPARALVAAALVDAVPLSAAELTGLCDRLAASGRPPSDQEAASMLLAVTSGAVRDGAWTPVTRETAAGHAMVWADVVRRAPEGLVASAAAVLGFLAWLRGDGALAWCALDRCFAEAPEHSLGRLVAQILSGALAPTAWETMGPALAASGSGTWPAG